MDALRLKIEKLPDNQPVSSQADIPVGTSAMFADPQAIEPGERGSHLLLAPGDHEERLLRAS